MQLRDTGFLPQYFNKDQPYWCTTSPRWDALQCAHTTDHVYNSQTIQISISNKDTPMGGLDEWRDISSCMEFQQGWAKFGLQDIF